ncbi:hypothetical protein DITRI_Ditri06bG0144300 [Diplodiscus trichospermus]
MKPNSWLLIFMLIIGILFSHDNRMVVATEGVSASSFNEIPSHDVPAYKFNVVSKRRLRSGRPPPPSPKPALTRSHPIRLSPPPPSPLPPPIST